MSAAISKITIASRPFVFSPMMPGALAKNDDFDCRAADNPCRPLAAQTTVQFSVPRLTDVEPSASSAEHATVLAVAPSGEVLAASVVSSVAKSDSAAPEVWLQPVEVTPRGEVNAYRADSGWDFNVNWGGVLLGGVAVAGGATLLSSVSGQDEEDSAFGGTGNRIEGRVVAGPVIQGNGLAAIVYNENFERLNHQDIKVADDGRFKVDVGSYQGGVFVQIVDSNEAADYLDETIGNKDLENDLWAMATLSSDALYVTVNPATTIAYLKASELQQKVPTPEDIDHFNRATAQAFGLTEMVEIEPVPVNDLEQRFNSDDSLNEPELYGLLLARLSGMEYYYQVQSPEYDPLMLLTESLQVEQDLGAFDQDGMLLLEQGGKAFFEQGADSPPGMVMFVNPVVELNIPENVTAGQVVYQVDALGQGKMQYRLAGQAAEYMRIDAASGELTVVTIPEQGVELQHLIVIAEDAAGNSSMFDMMLLPVSADKKLAINPPPQTPPLLPPVLSEDGDPPEVATQVPAQERQRVSFDLLNGDANTPLRQFDADVSYQLEIRVSSHSSALNVGADSWSPWRGGDNLGADDKLVLTSEGAGLLGNSQLEIDTAAVSFWSDSQQGIAAVLTVSGQLSRYTANGISQLDLWTGQWSSMMLGAGSYQTGV